MKYIVQTLHSSSADKQDIRNIFTLCVNANETIRDLFLNGLQIACQSICFFFFLFVGY
jgi:hypothetical protein